MVLHMRMDTHFPPHQCKDLLGRSPSRDVMSSLEVEKYLTKIIIIKMYAYIEMDLFENPVSYILMNWGRQPKGCF